MSAASAAKSGSAQRVAAAATAKQPPRSGMRTGTVVSIDSNTTLTVNISGMVIQNMSYLDSYGPIIGDVVQVLMMNNTWCVIGHVGADPWVDWSDNLTWSGTSTNGVFGNSTPSAAYHVIGDTVDYQGSIFIGSTATIPTGTWSVNLPFPIATLVASGTGITGSAVLFDSSTAANRESGSCLSSGQTTLIFYGSGQVSDTVPFTWASPDRIFWSIRYPRAT